MVTLVCTTGGLRGQLCGRFLQQKLRRIGLLALLSCSIALSGCSWGGAGSNLGSGSLIAVNSTVTFGSVPVGNRATTVVTLVNQSAAPVEISQLGVTGQ